MSYPEYQKWVEVIKAKVRKSHLSATIKVNKELLSLYWEIGKELDLKSSQGEWGEKIITAVSKDLVASFPQMRGFEKRNLERMRQWYRFYQPCIEGHGDEIRIASQLATQLKDLLFCIPWGHHIYILTKCKQVEEAAFYIRQTVNNGWSRSILSHNISMHLYDRQGKAITNFKANLPLEQSELVQQLTKDPYIFDFLDLTETHDEKTLESFLESKMSQFLLELGKGFCYYGRQVKIEMEHTDYYIDLLFYNVIIHAYFVVELKSVRFKPEHLGQLNFYVNAVDNILKSKDDNPTIGLLICKEKEDLVVEYSLSGISTPLGVASYDMYPDLVTGYKNTLPTIEEIENEIKSLK